MVLAQQASAWLNFKVVPVRFRVWRDLAADLLPGATSASAPRLHSVHARRIFARLPNDAYTFNRRRGSDQDKVREHP